MAKIKKIWFDDKRIYLLTDGNKELSRPLEAYPILKEASDEERMSFTIGKFGDDIRWEKLDEDIHLSSFYETTEPNAQNEVAAIFSRFSWLNISEVARSMGIHKSLLARYIYGISKPSQQRLQQIKDTLHQFGRELQSA